jgi:Bacterial regulatory proteins, gntR family
MDRIGIKHPPGTSYYAIKFLVTPHEVAAIPVSNTDILSTRPPNHLEARRLHTDPGELIIEIQLADSTVEAYRSSRMVLRANGTITLPGGIVPDGAAFRLTGDPAVGPDLRKPYWRHVYDDISADIATGRLTTGSLIGTTLQLADAYVLSTFKIEQAMHQLYADRLIECHGDTWYVACPASPGTCRRPAHGS